MARRARARPGPVNLDPEVMRYVGDYGPLSREEAWRQLAMLPGHGMGAGPSSPARETATGARGAQRDRAGLPSDHVPTGIKNSVIIGSSVS